MNLSAKGRESVNSIRFADMFFNAHHLPFFEIPPCGIPKRGTEQRGFGAHFLKKNSVACSDPSLCSGWQ